jgi:hypothetical protein
MQFPKRSLRPHELSLHRSARVAGDAGHLLIGASRRLQGEDASLTRRQLSECLQAPGDLEASAEDLQGVEVVVLGFGSWQSAITEAGLGSG